MNLNVNSLWSTIFTFRKKSHRYKISRRDFYEGRNFLNSQERILNLIRQRDINSLSTERQIRFYGLSFGSTQKAAIKHLGKPNYSTKEKILTEHSILFYRITIGNIQCVLQLHFLKNEFFLGVIEQKNAFSLTDYEIAKLIRNKYGVQDNQWTGIIYDQHQNRVEITQGPVQRIIYSSSDTNLYQSIKYQLLQLDDRSNKFSHLRAQVMLDMI